MKIWVVTVGEPLPTDEGNDRLHRGGMIATSMVNLGHEVVWWSSSFNHSRRVLRSEKTERIQVQKNFNLYTLFGGGYKRNISLERIQDHRRLALEFKAFCEQEDRPDIIIASYPTIELCVASIEYGKKHGIPVVIDVRDLWPDIFIDPLPAFLKPIGKLLLSSFNRQARYVFRNATAVVGVSEQTVVWGLKKGVRQRSSNDVSFPFGYPALGKQSDTELYEQKQFWAAKGLSEDKFIVSFFGNIGHQFDLETVIEAARRLDNETNNISFVLCGDGDRLEEYRKMAKGLSNLIFPGWINKSQIIYLLGLSKVGLAPYIDKADFNLILPNKIFEYMAGGIPILSSVSGEIGHLLKDNKCGLVYRGVGDLEAKLVSLYQHKDELSRLSGNASAAFNEKYTAEKIYSDMADYFSGLSGNYSKLSIAS